MVKSCLFLITSCRWKLCWIRQYVPWPMFLLDRRDPLSPRTYCGSERIGVRHQIVTSTSAKVNHPTSLQNMSKKMHKSLGFILFTFYQGRVLKWIGLCLLNRPLFSVCNRFSNVIMLLVYELLSILLKIPHKVILSFPLIFLVYEQMIAWSNLVPLSKDYTFL